MYRNFETHFPFLYFSTGILVNENDYVKNISLTKISLHNSLAVHRLFFSIIFIMLID